jgi:DNA-binding ferritin-like protein
MTDSATENNNSKKAYFEEYNNFIANAVAFQIKLLYLHWNTQKYSTHIAANVVYNDWHENLDKFVESYLGSTVTKNSKRQKILYKNENQKYNVNNASNLVNDITNFHKQIEKIYPKSSSDIKNLLDNFTTILNSFSYLLTLS